MTLSSKIIDFIWLDFLDYSTGVPSSNLSVFDGESIQSVYKALGDSYGYGDQQAFLGYQSYLINQVDDLPNNYVSNALYSNVNQLLSIDRKGDHLVHSLSLIHISEPTRPY